MNNNTIIYRYASSFQSVTMTHKEQLMWRQISYSRETRLSLLLSVNKKQKKLCYMLVLVSAHGM